MRVKNVKGTKRADSEKMSPLLLGLTAVCLALLAVLFFIDAAPQDGCIQINFFDPVVGVSLGIVASLLSVFAAVQCIRYLRKGKQ